MDIGKKIRSSRQSKGMSQLELAKRIGVNRRSIEYWETGKMGITLENADKVFKALGISITIGATEDT